MNITSHSSGFLSFNQPILQSNDLDQLISMWSVLSKCKQHLEDGPRLENLSWRLWHQKQQQEHQQQQQQHFVQPILSLSAGNDCHEVSQKKQTQHDQVNEKKEKWSFSSSSSKINHTTSPQPPQPPSSSSSSHNNSRTTTPSLSDSYQYDDDDDDDLYDEDDDLFDDDLYDDDLYDDEDDEELSMHNNRRTNEKLRSATAAGATSNQHYFEKKSLPPRQPLIQQPSLLSALFKTPSTSTSSSSSSSNNINISIHTTTPSDHFLKKELTESLRNNVLWEHSQQKPHQRTSNTFYQHPPPSHAYQPPLLSTHRFNNINNRTPNKKSTRLPPDQGWLESFHGW